MQVESQEGLNPDPKRETRMASTGETSDRAEPKHTALYASSTPISRGVVLTGAPMARRKMRKQNVVLSRRMPNPPTAKPSRSG